MKLFEFLLPELELIYWMCDGKVVAIQDLDELYVDVIFLVKYCNFRNSKFMQFDNATVKFDFGGFLRIYLENLIDDDYHINCDLDLRLFIENIEATLEV